MIETWNTLLFSPLHYQWLAFYFYLYFESYKILVSLFSPNIHLYLTTYLACLLSFLSSSISNVSLRDYSARRSSFDCSFRAGMLAKFIWKHINFPWILKDIFTKYRILGQQLFSFYLWEDIPLFSGFSYFCLEICFIVTPLDIMCLFFSGFFQNFPH